MSLARYVVGLLELGLLVLGCLSVAMRVRDKAIPTWRGPHAVLSTVILTLAALCLTLQLLGAVSLLRQGALAAAGALLLAARGLRRPVIRGAVLHPQIRWQAGICLGLLAALAAVWAVEIKGVVLHGVLDIDSLTYHLPFAQEWAQTHRIGPLIHVAAGTPVQYYPGNDELLHASGLVAFGRDVLGPWINVGWLALLVLAAVALGARRKRLVGATALVVILAGGPLLAKFMPGGAMSDIATLALVLAVVALVVESTDSDDLGGLVVAGAAAGLAVGTKLTVLPLLGALTLALLVNHRWRPWLGFAGALLVPSLFWYVRDLVLTGSPVPFLAVPGLPSPAFSLFDNKGQSVLHYATNGRVIKTVFVPQTYDVLGPAWWLLVVLLLAGVIVGLRRQRPLAVAALVGGLAYLVTPTTAGGPEGRPLLFAVDVRYALPSVLVGIALLLVVLNDRWARAVEALLVLGAIATLVAPWRLTVDIDQDVALTVAAGLVGSLLVLARRPPVAVVVVLALAALYPAAVLSERHAYNDDRSPAAYRYLRDRTGLTVAVTGNLRSSPYAGRGLGNRVHYLGVVTKDGGFEDFRDCLAWRRAAVAEKDDLYVVDRFARRWVTDPAFVRVVPEKPDEPLLLRIEGVPEPATCV